MFLSAFGMLILLLQNMTVVSVIHIKPDDPSIQFDGRYKEFLNGVKEFDAPGFRINMSVRGAEQVDILLTANGIDQPHCFWIYVDGKKTDLIIDTVDFPVGATEQHHVATNLDREFHEISVVKVTEADFSRADPVYNTLSFSGFVLDDGEAVEIQQPQSGQSRKIQFIGDSITAGYCNMCNEVPYENDGTYYAQESLATSWPYLVATKFSAAYQVAAWSGFGMYRNCCGGEVEMPEIFSRTLASLSLSDNNNISRYIGSNSSTSSSTSNTWDYSVWVPDVVIINLGTNDNLYAANTNGEAETAYQAIYTDFVRNISMWYSNPVVFLACGPMSSEYCPYVFNVIDTLKDDVKVHFLDQRDVLNDSNQCCGHPDKDADVVLADITTETVATVMGWDY